MQLNPSREKAGPIKSTQDTALNSTQDQVVKKIFRLEAVSAIYTQKLYHSQNHRLLAAAVAFATLIAAAFAPNLLLLQIIGFLIAPFSFIFFFIQSKRYNAFVINLEELLKFYKRQNHRLTGLVLEGVKPVVIDPMPPLARDLDLLDRHSLFHLLDETFSPAGQNCLLQKMFQTDPSADEIHRNQKGIRSMSRFHWFLTRTVLVGRQNKDLFLHEGQLKDFLERPLLTAGFKRDYLILKVLFTFEVIAIAWYGWHKLNHLPTEVNPNIFITLHFFYSMIAATNLKGVFERANDVALHLTSLMPVLKMFESQRDNEVLKPYIQKTLKFSPTQRLKSLHWIISALSIQGHAIVYILINGLMPWSFFFSKQLEHVRKKMSQDFPDVLDELAEFEALSSLALFHHYQTQSFPEISEKPQLSFENAYHPLIDRKKVVANSFSLKEGRHLNLITGSNMSGKSTFLRTIGVNHLLFLMGAPVFAQNYKAYPYPIESCIRVTDSLEDGFSYFYAEVIRLKHIIDKTQSTHPVLYLIDEIFKGTNNRERLIGSQFLLKEMAETNSIGFVTTHDLELTHLSEQVTSVENYHFKDDVSQDELVFDYQIQDGPCPTTNALKIMIKAGLPVKIEEKRIL